MTDRKALIASAVSGPTPGIVCSRRAVPVCAARFLSCSVLASIPFRLLGNLVEEGPTLFADQLEQTVALPILARLPLLGIGSARPSPVC